MTWKEGEIKVLLLCFDGPGGRGEPFSVIDNIEKLNPYELSNEIKNQFENYVQRTWFPRDDTIIVCKCMFLRKSESNKTWFNWSRPGDEGIIELVFPASYRFLSKVFELDLEGNTNKTYDDD
jgi:hypothetical protein